MRCSTVNEFFQSKLNLVFLFNFKYLYKDLIKIKYHSISVILVFQNNSK